MSLTPSTPKHPSSIPPRIRASRSSRSQRVLACVLCQRRKVKCDRQFPCSNCTKFKTQCVPATLAPRRQRHKFTERELLDRIRKYEDLLQQNNVGFTPFHGGSDSVVENDFPNTPGGDYGSGDGRPESMGTGPSSPSSTFAKPKESHEFKNFPGSFWYAMKQQGCQGPNNESESSQDDVNEVGVKKVWDEVYTDNSNLLFGSPKTAVELSISPLHPKPVQIFKLWQIYLDNVEPLLKVTHTPSLQGRLIEAAGNLPNVSSALEALMFSIYSMSILSLTADDCQATFGFPKQDLLSRYQFGCQQALLNCDYLRTSDRECLTAFYLFLVSIRPVTDPRSLSSMLGVAMRIAYRMGIHSESACVKYTALEGEMRRRLWWSLKLFDTRISEIADYKSIALAPSWDCRIPLNVNDSDLRAEMKEPPPVQGKSSDALFAVVRSELADFVRHTRLRLAAKDKDAMQGLVRDEGGGGGGGGGDSELVALENMIEDKYLKFCNPENPLHFMTIWTTRTRLAKCRLIEYYSRYSDSSTDLSEAQQDAAIFHALKILKCDTTILNSPSTKGYVWFTQLFFPFPAYIHILQTLRRRPTCSQAKQAWEIINDNFEARSNAHQGGANNPGPLLNIISGTVLRAWQACEAAATATATATSTTPRALSRQNQQQPQRQPQPISQPKIVSYAQDSLFRKFKMQQQAYKEQQQPQQNTSTDPTVVDMLNTGSGGASGSTNNTVNNLPIGSNCGLFHDMGGGGGGGEQDAATDSYYAGTGFDIIPGQAQLDIDVGVGSIDWGAMAWDFGGGNTTW